MTIELLQTLMLKNEIWGYDCVIDGDRMIASVYCGDHHLYDVALG